jgi:hypothetical protein
MYFRVRFAIFFIACDSNLSEFVGIKVPAPRLAGPC